MLALSHIGKQATAGMRLSSEPGMGVRKLAEVAIKNSLTVEAGFK